MEYKIYKQFYVPTKNDPWWAKGDKIYVKRLKGESIGIKREFDTLQKAIEELNKIQVGERRYVILDENNNIIETKEPTDLTGKVISIKTIN